MPGAGAARGQRGHGRADYLLYVDQLAVGVIEAKPAGTTLSGVEWQSSMYAEGLPAEVRLKAVTTGRVLSRALLAAAFSGRLTGRSSDRDIAE